MSFAPPGLVDRLMADGLLDRENLLAVPNERSATLAELRGIPGLCPDTLARLAAEQGGLPYIDADTVFPDVLTVPPACEAACLRHGFLPVRARGGEAPLVLCSDPDADVIEAARYWFPGAELALTSRQALNRALRRAFNGAAADSAVNGLWTRRPEFSARSVLSPWQTIALAYLIVIGAVAAIVAPRGIWLALVGATSLLFSGIFVFKLILLGIGAAGRKAQYIVSPHDIADMAEKDLPLYTILVPLHREAGIVEQLVRGLRRLDYPKGKLDIKLILERDDADTIEAVQDLQLEDIFDVLIAPDVGPRTKPKACNYALYFARGSFVTIYDAEDEPEPDQLKKALFRFSRGDARLVCVQARLNFYNRSENWLTRLFTLDYAMWFDHFLPGLDRLGAPIPLGGTSNHFRTDVLRDLGGWDPFNVTEDADLGIRMAQAGYEVGLVNSTTLEEANTSVGNWIRQRSRWLKGYMQTWLVHMRQPGNLLLQVGLIGFLSFQLFVAGNFIGALIYPLFAALLIGGLIFGPEGQAAWQNIMLGAFVLGNALFVYLSMIAPVHRGWLSYAPYGLTAPAYWVLQSIAGYKALFQLLTRPFYWEKTHHGLSRMRRPGHGPPAGPPPP